MDLKYFNHFLNPGSEIQIRHFKPEHAFSSYFLQNNCRHSTIIIVKVWLSKILPEVHKILFVDTDMINIAPISDIWKFDMTGKTIAATLRVKRWWINSGFIFYNLDEIRKRPNVIKCSFRNTCFIDDIWHSLCHFRSIKIVPYRYNVELILMIEPDKDNETRKYRFDEENRTVFFHLKDRISHAFYSLKRSELPKIYYARKSERALFFLNKLYYIREYVDSELKKIERKWKF